MKKKIGIAGVLCLLGLVIWLGMSRTNNEERGTVVQEPESVSDTESVPEADAGPETGSANTMEPETGSANTMDPATGSANAVDPATGSANAADPATGSANTIEPETEPAPDVEEFTLTGSYAIADVDNYVNVRNAPSTEGTVVGKMYDDAVAEIVAVAGELEDWFQITSGNVEGYVKSEFFLYGEAAAEFVSVSEEYSYAKTLEEDRAEKAAKAEKENSQRIPAMTGVFPVTTYTSNEELRKNIVNYALAYVGNKYIHGGSSLAEGTDCSGFTCFIYKDFGYSISRIPQGQFTDAGRSIDYSEIQPGDIICYSSNGGKSCTHVALYIGDGQIVHAANSRKGVIVADADYDTIIGIRNVID